MTPPAQQVSEPFEERIGMLYDELSLAVRWDRPSILLAVYASDLVCAEAQLTLAQRLAVLGQSVLRLAVDAESSDIPMYLSKYPGREKTIFFIKRLKRVGKQPGPQAYRALNIRRELLVDHHIRVVFWITEKEAADLPVLAPDFWAFRHRVIEFLDPPAPERLAALAASARLEQGADELLEAFKKALKLDPQNVALWSSLGDVCARLGRNDEAVRAFRKATRLEDRNAGLWVRLGDLYAGLGRTHHAGKAYQAALRIEPGNRQALAGLEALKADKV